MLKPCPYRNSNQRQLECEIAKNGEKRQTSLTSVEVCSHCQIPEIIQQVNCENFAPEKLHFDFTSPTFDVNRITQIVENSWEASCQKIHFQTKFDYKVKCSSDCAQFQPTHRNLSTEESISIPEFDSTTATDHQLRQAILIILYQYQDRHPERYYNFDVTPEFIAKNLYINEQDVLRVIFPMEEEKEVVLQKYLGEEGFRYVRITNTGIKMIDENPLFGKLGTAEIRSINIENQYITASEGGIVNFGTLSGQVTNTINKLPSSPDPNKPGIKELLEQLKTTIESEPNLSNEDKTDALEHIQTIAEAGQKPQESRVQKIVKAPIQALQFIISKLPDAVKLAEAGKTLIPSILSFFHLP